MDACVEGLPMTPRTGKPVEVNALWINGLTALAGLKDRLGGDSAGLYRAADAARASFSTRFSGGCWLPDAVDCPEPPYPRAGGGGGADGSLRPNQLLAFSLPYPAMKPDPQVLAVVGARLLTPLGLRSLAESEPGYTGRHAGGPAQRDSAYHQGTVWPWLIGPYLDTLVAAAAPTAGVLAALEAHLAEYGLGSVSETAEGTAPHRATGCPFQAWSVAEFLRVRRKIRCGLPPRNENCSGVNPSSAP
jgi:glycogen debranching enzyme